MDREQARRYLLNYHFLLPPASLAGGEGVDAVLRRLRCIQVDPLNVTGKNVDLVLQSRISDYRPEVLERALYGECRYLEAWDKLRSVVPAEDWSGLTAYRERMRARYAENPNPPTEVIEYVRTETAVRAPLSSRDLEDKGVADWRWAPAKAVRAALELLFDWGEIGIVGRQGSRKLYGPMRELLERAGVEAAASQASPDRESYLKTHIARRVRSLGLAAGRSGDGWLGVDRVTATERSKALNELVEEGVLRSVSVEGVRGPCYMPGNHEPGDGAADSKELTMETPVTGTPAAAGASFLAPLDNLLWDRRLIEELFGFSYRWEVYKPASQRQYGYYVLPVLYGDRFVARWEPRRRDGHLGVDGWWWEPGTRVTPEMSEAIGEAIQRFLRFLELEAVELDGKLDEGTRGFILEAAAGKKVPVRRRG